MIKQARESAFRSLDALESFGNVSPFYPGLLALDIGGNLCSNPDTDQPTNSRIMNRNPEV